MNRILITGGQGYIGNHLTAAFHRQGWDVVTYDSHHNNRMPFADMTKIGRFNAITTNLETIQRAMQGCMVVYHLANRHDWKPNFRHPIRLVESNVKGLTAVLSAAKQAGVGKVVIASTYEVYGNQVYAKETDPLMPMNMVAATAVAAEAMARGYYQTGMDIVLLRLAKVWGRDCGSIVSRFVAGDGAVEGDPDRTRDFIHIDDAVHALMSARVWDGNIYNIGTGDEISIRGLWDMLHPEEQLQVHRLRGYSTQQRISLDPEFTKAAMDWEAQIRLADMNADEIRKHCQL